jgi:hypothetical protein
MKSLKIIFVIIIAGFSVHAQQSLSLNDAIARALETTTTCALSGKINA